jgi:hypothetical protein
VKYKKNTGHGISRSTKKQKAVLGVLLGMTDGLAPG